MSELEDQLNKVLSSPKDLEKIMEMARSLSGSLGLDGSSEKSGSQNENGGESSDGGPSGDGDGGPFGGDGGGPSGWKDAASAFSAFGGLDPKILSIVTRLMSEYSSSRTDKSALLNAMKPYLKPERQKQLDEAAKTAKIAHIAKLAFSEFSGSGGNRNV